VRNRRDGCVEAIFEGEADAVRAAVEFMRVGPPAASVRNVEVVWSAATGAFAGFRIAR
jgi:acylphosphatase